MSTGNIVGLIVCALMFGVMMLGLSGVLDRMVNRIRDGKWPERPKAGAKKSKQVLYVGMGDFWIDEDARCLACDALFLDAGGFFYFENGPWKCCVDCMDVPMATVAANIFQRRKDWTLHAHFCSCTGEPSKPLEDRYVSKPPHTSTPTGKPGTTNVHTMREPPLGL